MDTLPLHAHLDISSLGRCFRNVQNSYKFYWLLSILDHLAEGGEPNISLEELAVRMLSAAWYPLDYYKLSFGSQDGFKDLAEVVSRYLTVDNGVKAPSLRHQIEAQLAPGIAGKLKHKIKVTLKRWVVCRFLSPFFEEQVRGHRDQYVNDIIKKLTHDVHFQDVAPYRIDEDYITINANWYNYLQSHQSLLRGFIKWHLLKFLQKKNPNVIGLSEKLEKPQQRDLTVANRFWTTYLQYKPLYCIYSQERLFKENFSLDHFLPWSYVAHDLLWNIVPTTKNINSSKSDYLPRLEQYLPPFSQLQFDALQFYIKRGNTKILEDYNLLLNCRDLTQIDAFTFQQSLDAEISNHYRIAANLGFRTGYNYNQSMIAPNCEK